MESEQPRPAALTAICIIAIVLGAMGAAGSNFGLVGLLLLREAFREMQEEHELYRKMYEVMDQYASFQWVAAPLNAVVSVCLIVGGILALRPSLASRQFLTAAMIASIPIDLVLMTIGVLVQLDILEIMEHSIPTSDIPEEPFLRIFGMIGMAFGVLFGLGKLVYYGWGVAILRGEKVKSWNH